MLHLASISYSIWLIQDKLPVTPKNNTSENSDYNKNASFLIKNREALGPFGIVTKVTMQGWPWVDWLCVLKRWHHRDISAWTCAHEKVAC
jgi:hypothetical protein